MIKIAIVKLNSHAIIGYGNSSREASEDADRNGYDIRSMSISYRVVRVLPALDRSGRNFIACLKDAGVYYRHIGTTEVLPVTGFPEHFVDSKHPINLRYEIRGIDIRFYDTWTEDDNRNVTTLEAAGEFNFMNKYRRIRSALIHIYREKVEQFEPDREKLLYAERERLHGEFVQLLQEIRK